MCCPPGSRGDSVRVAPRVRRGRGSPLCVRHRWSRRIALRHCPSQGRPPEQSYDDSLSRHHQKAGSPLLGRLFCYVPHLARRSDHPDSASRLREPRVRERPPCPFNAPPDLARRFRDEPAQASCEKGSETNVGMKPVQDGPATSFQLRQNRRLRQATLRLSKRNGGPYQRTQGIEKGLAAMGVGGTRSCAANS